MPHSVRGVAAAAVGVLMFGTNYIPVRRYETYDGVFFQVPRARRRACR